MKRLLACALLAMTACAYSNQYGKCIGFFDKPDPNLDYDVSVRNAVFTTIGVHLLIPPIVWAISCVECPSGRKNVPMSCAEPFNARCASLTSDPLR